MEMSKTQIAVLAAAREILKELDRASSEARYDIPEDSTYDAWDLGLFSHACKGAEEALFDVLNVAHSYLGIETGI